MVILKRIFYPITAVILCAFLAFVFYISSYMLCPSNDYFFDQSFGRFANNKDFVIRDGNYEEPVYTSYLDDYYNKRYLYLEDDSCKVFTKSGVFFGAFYRGEYLVLFTMPSIKYTSIINKINNYKTKGYSGFDQYIYLDENPNGRERYNIATNEIESYDFDDKEYLKQSEIEFEINEKDYISFIVDEKKYYFHPSMDSKNVENVMNKWSFYPKKTVYYPFDNSVGIVYQQKNDYFLIFYYNLATLESRLSVYQKGNVDEYTIYPIHDIDISWI